MSMLFSFSMSMDVLMNGLSVNMHVFVNKVDTEKECHVVEHLGRISIDFNTVILAHDYGPLADLFDGF